LDFEESSDPAEDSNFFQISFLLVLKSFLEGFKDEHESTKETPFPKNKPSCIIKISIFIDIVNFQRVSNLP